MFVKARLARGAPAERAAQTLTGLGARLAASYPETNRGRTFATRRRRRRHADERSVDGDRVVFPGGARAYPPAVGFVVLIASTAVGNLMFARAASQGAEIAVRPRAGASRPAARRAAADREPQLHAAIGGALGLGLAFVFAQLLIAFRPPTLVLISLPEVGVDGRVRAVRCARDRRFAGDLLGGFCNRALQASRPLADDRPERRCARTLAKRSRLSATAQNAFLVPQCQLSVVLLVVAVTSFYEKCDERRAPSIRGSTSEARRDDLARPESERLRLNASARVYRDLARRADAGRRSFSSASSTASRLRSLRQPVGADSRRVNGRGRRGRDAGRSVRGS